MPLNRGMVKNKKYWNEYMRFYIATNDRYFLLNKLSKIRRRCYNPNDKVYHTYGGRGIKIHQGWLENQDSFVEWALQNGFDRKLQIDRIDTNGPYSPENCRFVTSQENNRNRRNNKLDVQKVVEIRRLAAESLSDSKIAPMFGVDRALIYRIRKNQQWKI